MSEYLKRKIITAGRYFGLELKRYRHGRLPEEQIFNLLKTMSIKCVIDIGANEGQFAEELFGCGFQGLIYSVEPQIEAHKILQKKAERVSAWSCGPRVAIGADDRRGIIHKSENSVSSSLLPMLDKHKEAAPGSAYAGEEEIEIMTLDNLLQSWSLIEAPLALKIDTQGYEWEVLQGARQALSMVKVVICELSTQPLYDGQKLWREIVEYLFASGFELRALIPNFTDLETGETLQFDGIFVSLSKDQARGAD